MAVIMVDTWAVIEDVVTMVSMLCRVKGSILPIPKITTMMISY